MTRKMRGGAIVALSATIALLAAGCGGSGDGGDADDTSSPAAGGSTEITWWHNGTGEPLLSFYNTVAKEFEDAHPGVTVKAQAFQNEELRETILPNAIAGGTAPDLFQSWGGGELTEYVKNGVVKDVSAFVPEAAKSAAEAGFGRDGKIYGMPYTVLPSGFWVNMDLWEKAGLTEDDFPETLDDLFAVWDTLKAAGVNPVAVGGVDGWPAAHWWYWTALRSVSPDAMQAAINDGDFSDEGWVEASELLKTIIDRGAFNEGWQATSAQQGAASASGMVVMGQAATQLMGTWDYGTMGGIYNEAQGLAADAQDHAKFLKWFPFPQVPGADGDPKAIMGGVDGFSVAADAPDEASELLAYILSDDVQKRYAALGNIPVNPAATASMPEGPLQPAAEAVANASSVQLWLDTALGPKVGGGMNDAIVAFMNGSGTPQDVVDSLTALAAG